MTTSAVVPTIPNVGEPVFVEHPHPLVDTGPAEWEPHVKTGPAVIPAAVEPIPATFEATHPVIDGFEPEAAPVAEAGCGYDPIPPHEPSHPLVDSGPAEWEPEPAGRARRFLVTTFSVPQRRTLAAKGQAEPDGSYPIRNADDLHNAIQAIGRSKNPAKTKAFIRKRAAELGMSSAIPVSWN